MSAVPAVPEVDYGDCHGTAGLFDNVLSDYLWARAVLLIGMQFSWPSLILQSFFLDKKIGFLSRDIAA